MSFSGASAAAGVGVTWGSGTLRFEGKDYPFKLQGFGVADIGGSSIQGTGDVYNLKRVEDFAGRFRGGVGGGGAGQGHVRDDDAESARCRDASALHDEGHEGPQGGRGRDLELRFAPYRQIRAEGGPSHPQRDSRDVVAGISS